MSDMARQVFYGLFVELVSIVVALLVGDDRRKQVAIIFVGTVIAGLVAFSPFRPTLLSREKPAPTQPAALPTSTPAPLPSVARVLIDTYHGSDLLGSTHKQLLRKRGFEFEKATGAFTTKQLSSYDILMVDLAYYGDQNQEFSDDELIAIKEHISQGGSVFLSGLGWVWTSYGRRPIEEYPLNIIAEEYGIWFVDDYVWNVEDDTSPIFHAPFMNMEHPITQGVSQIAAPGMVPGSLIVEPPALPIIWGDDSTEGFWDNKNPVILAAASVGEGKIVCLQHGSYVTSLSDEYDNFRLFENILMWLVSK